MTDTIFNYLTIVDEFLWSYIGFTLVSLFGLYFTIKTRFFQFRMMGRLRQTLTDLNAEAHRGATGTNPLRLYFASVGGMVGIGNIVGVVTAVLIGGPGALFWLWIASFSGMLIKYSEIYLGMKYRVPNGKGGYDGGPMYYLKAAFGLKIIPIIIAVLLCIYGVEISIFLIITDTVSHTFSFNKSIIIGALLIAVIYSSLGGIKRLANICCILMPAFMIGYVVMCLWVIALNVSEIPSVLGLVFDGAFSGHAPLGGFVGSTFLIAAQSGMSRAVYSGDIGIGFDAIIQSESQSQKPEHQARMAIFSLLTDGIICTMSMLVVLVTGVWNIHTDMQASEYVAFALSNYFPGTPYFMAVLIFIAGFTTIIAYFAVGLKSARFLFPKHGEKIYYAYALLAFPFFSYFDFGQSRVFLIMTLSGGLLMLINLMGIIKLRKEIKFK
ncbi:MAG: amino acid carrier protein [Alphaproteobacteria bacterium]|nr:amino acid carrier protein [Alphaproteobacteria bacterium]